MFVYRFSVTSDIFFFDWSIESATGDDDRRLMIAAWHFKLSDFFLSEMKICSNFPPEMKNLDANDTDDEDDDITETANGTKFR